MLCLDDRDRVTDIKVSLSTTTSLPLFFTMARANPSGYQSFPNDSFNQASGNPFSDSNTHIPLSSTNYGGQPEGAQSMTDLNASSYNPYRDAPGSSNVVEHNSNWMEPGYNHSSSGKRRWVSALLAMKLSHSHYSDHWRCCTRRSGCRWSGCGSITLKKELVDIVFVIFVRS